MPKTYGGLTAEELAALIAKRGDWEVVNAQCIAARNALPDLLAEVERLQKAAQWALDEMDGRPRGPGCIQALRTALED